MAKIIIADDDIEILELIKTALENDGHSIIGYNNGFDAYEAIVKEKPDLVVLDVMMPRMNGYEVCEKLRETPSTKTIPIVMLTAQSQIKDKITGLKLGADDYITKPFDPLELAARVESIIKRCNKAKSDK
ncbi:MAG: hypothetical protein A2539_03700 [Elusimicrobia bacterium RIFOXYD2_FULL_34_15]|nr:MAG: hypothetical protein A2539_03700 [Elusimicrobia bacterium RIFOXYD2_FULL_34_15]